MPPPADHAEGNPPLEGGGGSGGGGPKAPEGREREALASMALSQIDHLKVELERAIEAFAALAEIQIYWRPAHRWESKEDE